jgi:hypothetical protein
MLGEGCGGRVFDGVGMLTESRGRPLAFRLFDGKVVLCFTGRPRRGVDFSASKQESEMKQPGEHLGAVAPEALPYASTETVLSEWRRHLETEVIPALPETSEWKWVAVQLRRELARALPRA